MAKVIKIAPAIPDYKQSPIAQYLEDMAARKAHRAIKKYRESIKVNKNK